MPAFASTRLTSIAAGVLLGLTLNGCAVRERPATNWILRSGEDGQILLPPLPPKGKLVRLSKARSVQNNSPACDVSSDGIRLAWRGRTALVTLDPDLVRPAGSVDMKGAPMPVSGQPVADITWWRQFEGELAQRERVGCLAPGEAEAVSRRIVDNVALPPDISYFLHYGNYAKDGYLDLDSDFVLRQVSALRQRDIEPASGSGQVVGDETLYYRVAPRSGGGWRLCPLSVERHVAGKRVGKPRRPIAKFELPQPSRYVRYFFRAWLVAAGDRRIAILTTSRRDQMDPLTDRFKADPERFCATVDRSEAGCLAVPADLVIAPELRVRVQGREVFIPVGGNLGEALRAAGITNAAARLSSLSVKRRFEGRLLPVEFDSARRDVLRFVLVGGEEIRW